MDLTQIKGQLQSTTILKQVIQSDIKGRSYIFSGPAGVGKMSTAIAFAEGLMGIDPMSSPDFSFYRNDSFVIKTSFFIKNLNNPDFTQQIHDYFVYLSSRASRAISLGELKKSNLDLIQEMQQVLNQKKIQDYFSDDIHKKSVMELSEELETKKKIPISYVRSVIQDHTQKPSGKYRISVLGDFETSSIESQNAILKLLEEPPSSSIIILTTSNIKSLLATIISRTIVLPFNLLNTKTIAEICHTQNNSFSSTLELMTDSIHQYNRQKVEKVLHFFESVAPDVQHNHFLFEFIDSLEQKNNNDLSVYFLEEMIEFFRNLMLMLQISNRNLDMGNYLKKEYTSILTGIVQKVEISDIEHWVEKLATHISLIKKGNVKSKMVLPLLLVDISRWYQLSRR